MSPGETAITPESFATFGSLLRYLRQRALLSRAELARAAGYSESQIARLELDQRRPDATAVQARFVPALNLDTHPAWVTRLIALARPPTSARPNAIVPGPPIAGAPLSDLLATKLFVPRPRPALLSRPRLLALLDQALSLPLTLVAAPAGSGKTTLLVNWLAEKANGNNQTANKEVDSETRLPLPFLPFNVAWLSLDSGDNDLATFVRYLVAACQQLAAPVGQTTLALLQRPNLLPASALLAPLVNELVALPGTSVLVLDDMHVLTAPSIHTALTFLVEHLPPQLHLILSSRDEPPLPLARLRVRGQLLEVRARDLRFQPKESAQFLRESMGVMVTDELAAALDTRTEGWAAGLQLAALALQGRDDPGDVVAAISGSRRYLGDYLTGEVLGHLPAHLKAFVLQTSILERMCGPLCDAVLGMTTADGASPIEEYREAQEDQLASADQQLSSSVLRPSPGSYSQLILAELRRRQLLIVSLDDERRWYRYHHLFADMLRARLREGGSAGSVAQLHRRASAWYEAQGLLLEALQHALTGQDWERAARLLEGYGLQWLLNGQVQTVLGWIDTFPPSVMQQHPILLIHCASGLIYTNRIEAAEACLRNAEQALPPDTPDDRARLVRGRVALVRGIIGCLKGDLAQVSTLMQQALALLPETSANGSIAIMSARARVPAAIYGAATAYQLTGDVTEVSERRAADAIAPARATGYVTEMIRSYTTLAALQVLQGRLGAASATYAEVEQLIPGQEALRSLIGSPAYYVGMAELRYEWNDLDAAARSLACAMEFIQGMLAADADVIVRGYLALAKIQHAQRNGAAALATLDACTQLVHERKLFPQLLEPVAALRARLQLVSGQLPAALRWLEASSLSADDEPYFRREAAHLTMARLRIAAGQVEEIVSLLGRLLVDAEAKMRIQSVIDILIVQALAYSARNQRRQALATLEQALMLAEPEGYIRIFVDAGSPIANLLAQWIEIGALNNSIQVYSTRLLDAFPQG